LYKPLILNKARNYHWPYKQILINMFYGVTTYFNSRKIDFAIYVYIKTTFLPAHTFPRSFFSAKYTCL